MKSILTIEQLIENLDQHASDEFTKIIKSIDIPLSSFESYCSWKKDAYSRNCVHRTDAYEIILICWDADSETAVHDHGGQDCWVFQIDGTIEEKRFEKNETEALREVHKSQITAGGLTYMNDQMGYHSIKNISNSRAMTLHIYNSPIDACNVYNKEEAEFAKLEMLYDTVKGVVAETIAK